MTSSETISANLEATIIALGSLYLRQDAESMARPIGSWLEWLESEGYDQEGLGSFFQTPAFLAHWNADIKLEALYNKACEEQIATGEFIRLLAEKSPDYLKSVTATIDSLTESQQGLLATAGGTSSPHGLNRSNLSTGWKWAIRGAGGAVGGYIVYKSLAKNPELKGSGEMSPQSLGQDLERHTEKTIEQQIDTAFGGKDKEGILKTIAKDDLEIQEREYSQACEKIESGKRLAIDEYDRNEKVLFKQIEMLNDQKTELDLMVKNFEKDAIKEQERQLDNFVKNPKEFFKGELKDEFLKSPEGQKYQKEFDRLYSKHVQFDSVAQKHDMEKKGLFMDEEGVFKKALENTADLRVDFVKGKMLTLEQDARKLEMHEIEFQGEEGVIDVETLENYIDTSMQDKIDYIEEMIEQNAANKAEAMADAELEAQSIQIQDEVEATMRGGIKATSEAVEQGVEDKVANEAELVESEVESAVEDDIDSML